MLTNSSGAASQLLILSTYSFLKKLLFEGDEGSGKSSLISRIQGKPYNPDEHPLGTGLEYTYFDVRDEETEGDFAPLLRRLKLKYLLYEFNIFTCKSELFWGA